MSSVRSHDSSRQRIAPAEIVLVNWPLRDQKIASIATALALLGTATGAGWLSGQSMVGIIAGVAMFVATWRWWIPVTYGFGPAGVSQVILGRIFRQPWGSIARYETLERGVRLLSDTDDATISTFRGRYVAWRDRRDALLILLEFYLGNRSTDSRWSRSGNSRGQ